MDLLNQIATKLQELYVGMFIVLPLCLLGAMLFFYIIHKMTGWR